MITIVYSTHKDSKYNSTFKKHLLETVGIKDVQILEYINNNEFSLTEIYNKGLSESTNDIVIFCHNDIIFDKPYWGKRVLEHFIKRPEYGILGIAGTTFFPRSGSWWDVMPEAIGQVSHQENGKRWLTEFNKPFGNKIMDSINVDGLFFAVNKKIIKSNFDEHFGRFHFYDVSFCVDNFLKGVKIGVVSNIPVTHLSVGRTDADWEHNRIKFVEKYGENLPIKLPSTYPINKINEKTPLVSVIMPVYNYGDRIELAIQSVFQSTYQNFELIIIDDGSTNEYVKLKLDSIPEHPNIKIIHQENQGPSAARNNGILASKGEYILPLDADDRILPNYIQSCVDVLRNNKMVSPVYCDTAHDGEYRGIEKRPEWSMEMLVGGPFIVNCSMFRREAFDICNGYDTTMKGWEDYDLWIRMGLNGYVGRRIPSPLFVYFHHESEGTVSTEANANHSQLYKNIMKKNFNIDIVYNETV